VQDAGGEKEEIAESGGKGQKGTKERAKDGGGEDKACLRDLVLTEAGDFGESVVDAGGEVGESGGKGQKGTKEKVKDGGGEVGGCKAGGRFGRGSTGEEGGLGGRRVSEQDGREDGRNPMSPKSPVVLQKSTPLQPQLLSVVEQVCGIGLFHRLLLTYFLLTYELTHATAS
jgi:hypothetical protein